jgi:hypothetical protein
MVAKTEEQHRAEGWLRESDTLPRAVERRLKIGSYDQRRHVFYKFALEADGWEAWVCLDSSYEATEYYGYYLLPVLPEKEEVGELLFLTTNYQDCYTKITESWIFDMDGEKEIVTKELVYLLPDGQCDSEEATFPTIRTTVFHFVNGKFEKGQTKAEPNIHKKMSSVPLMIERYKEEGYGSMIPEGWE